MISAMEFDGISGKNAIDLYILMTIFKRIFLPLGSANMAPCFGEYDSLGYFKSAAHIVSIKQLGEPIIPISLKNKW